MPSLNQCNFIGRLGRDPETRYTPSGDPICNFSIACDWKYGDKEGTEWVRVVAFKKLAEICEQYLKKGAMVYISGRMQTRQWEKEGQKHYSTEIVASQMQMLDKRPDSQPQQDRAATSNNGAPPNFDDMSDDVPFAPIDRRLP